MDITFTCIGYKRTNPGKSKSKKLTIENIARLGALGFNWTSQEYVTRSFDEWIEDLKEYKRTHGHLSVNRHKDSSLFQFCTLRIIGYYIIIITLLYEITEQFHSMESSSSSSLSSTIMKVVEGLHRSPQILDHEVANEGSASASVLANLRD